MKAPGIPLSGGRYLPVVPLSSYAFMNVMYGPATDTAHECNVWKCEERGDVGHVLLWIFPIIALPCIGTPASVPLIPGLESLALSSVLPLASCVILGVIRLYCLRFSFRKTGRVVIPAL